MGSWLICLTEIKFVLVRSSQFYKEQVKTKHRVNNFKLCVGFPCLLRSVGFVSILL